MGFALLEAPDGVVMQVHPRLCGSGSLERKMLEWAAPVSALTPDVTVVTLL